MILSEDANWVGLVSALPKWLGRVCPPLKKEEKEGGSVGLLVS